MRKPKTKAVLIITFLFTLKIVVLFTPVILVTVYDLPLIYLWYLLLSAPLFGVVHYFQEALSKELRKRFKE